MCGIFALLNKEEITEDTIKAFNAGKSRGPEDSQIVQYDKLIMGFHRLAINGLNSNSNQPLIHNNIKLICNGEIYNFKELCETYDIKLTSQSDCEVIIHLYEKFGFEKTLTLLDGVFALVLFDSRIQQNKKIFIARDPYGVRPLYILKGQLNNLPIFGFASEVKVLNALVFAMIIINIDSFLPGSYSIFEENSTLENLLNDRIIFIPKLTNEKYINFPSKEIYPQNIYFDIHNHFNNAIKKRVLGTTDRPIACLLSGGLDSSIVCALVNKYYTGILETYSIGLMDSEDLKYAAQVAKHLKTHHTQIILTENEFFETIPKVIENIGTYDTTTIRASVGNYLLGKYISENSKAKVIFNGDGADELMGGYLYLHLAPDSVEFDKECKRLLTDIHYFDVLRSDRCISCHGLETRTPFLDRTWVNYYLSLPHKLRFHVENKKCEKFLFRKTFHTIAPKLLPKEILWRTKEAFSDGVSGVDRPWYIIIEEKIEKLCKEDKKLENILLSNLEYAEKKFKINPPKTLEQSYYRNLYNIHYAGRDNIIPYFWMPKYVTANDASARTLKIYGEKNKKIK